MPVTEQYLARRCPGTGASPGGGTSKRTHDRTRNVRLDHRLPHIPKTHVQDPVVLVTDPVLRPTTEHHPRMTRPVGPQLQRRPRHHQRKPTRLEPHPEPHPMPVNPHDRTIIPTTRPPGHQRGHEPGVRTTRHPGGGAAADACCGPARMMAVFVAVRRCACLPRPRDAALAHGGSRQRRSRGIALSASGFRHAFALHAP